MYVLIDGNYYGLSDVTTNERDSHEAFVADTIVVRGLLPAGSHTIRLEALDNANCDTQY
jgi:hypothetical protein